MARTSWKTAFPALLAHKGLSSRDRNVIEDMKRGYDRKGASYMTPGRRRYFKQIQEHSDSALEALAARAAGELTPLDNRLSRLAERVAQGTWAHGFVESLQEQAARGRRLSEAQVRTLEKIEAEYSDEAMGAMAAFAERWKNDTDKTRTNFHRVIDYYRAEAMYWRKTVHAVDDARALGKEYIPDLATWKKVVQNKYAQKVIAGYEQEPKYAVGSMVSQRSGRYIRDPYQRPSQQRKLMPLVIISTNETIVSAAQGNKRYKVLPVGSATPTLVEERDIKTYRPSKK
jgi:hypothetical protein